MKINIGPLLFLLILAHFEVAVSSSPQLNTAPTPLLPSIINDEKKWCDFEIDIYNCLNINCAGVYQLTKLPESLRDFNSSIRLEPNEILCSLDLAETGIRVLTTAIFDNFDTLLVELIRHNKNQTQTSLKISFSHITEIWQFKLPFYLNMVVFIRDSAVHYVQPKALNKSTKLELNLANFNTSSLNWFHLLDGAKLKLLSLRDIVNLKEEFNVLNKEFLIYPIATINDVKIYNSYLPIIDDYFLLFKLLKHIEQLELNSCSISFIKNSIFEKYSTAFRSLKYLALSNNNLNKISDGIFNGLTNLISLDLDDNPIEYIKPTAFDNLKRLKYLSVNTNNPKAVGFNSNLLWIFNALRTNRQLVDVSFKTSKLIKSTCLLNTLLSTIRLINENLINASKVANQILLNANNSTNMSSFFLNAETTTTTMTPIKRTVKIFTPDQIAYPFHNILNMNEIYCNAYLVCKLTSNQSTIGEHFSTWQVEVFKSCPLVVNDLAYAKCFIEKRISDCESSSSNKQVASQSNQHGQSTSESICATLTRIFYQLKWVVITAGLIVGVILFLLVIYCIRSCASRRSHLIGKETTRMKQTRNNRKPSNSSVLMNRSTSQRQLQVNHQPYYGGNDYYVILLNKDRQANR